MARVDSTEQRLSTLELLLLWEGFLNRGRLVSLLGLGDIRASQWIQEFRDQNPRWVVWDSKSRSYHATYDAYVAAKRNDNAASLAKYLNLVSVSHVVADSDTTGPICAAFPDLYTPDPRIFAALSHAIRSRLAIEVAYRSMKEPAAHQRLVSPHHLIRAGRRWHVRTYCSTNQEFRDYALGRIVNVVTKEVPQEMSEDADAAWNKSVAVRLVAHPDLNQDQESVIRFEYFNNTSARVVTCRGALVGYFIQDIHAATDIKKQQPPEYQIAIANMNEISPWLFP